MTQGQGQGGNLQISAQCIDLRDSGTIAASSKADGAAGTLRIQAGKTFRSDHGQVTTQSDRAGGGRIALKAGTVVHVSDSQITTSVQGGGSDAGSLSLDAPFVVAEGSQIRANAFGGMGGNIRISSEVFLADPASLVSASSTLGIAGTVDIRAPVTTLSGTLAPLPQAFVSAAALLPVRCAARAQGGKYSSLVLGGREGLPLEPDGLLPSPLAMDTQLPIDPAMIGVRRSPPAPAKLALLAGQEKALPQLQGGQWAGGCPK
jgi:hypothetical protein